MPRLIRSEECINCAACEEDCPTEAITRGDDAFVVDARRCVDCKEFYDAPHCVGVCPIDGCIVEAA